MFLFIGFKMSLIEKYKKIQSYVYTKRKHIFNRNNIVQVKGEIIMYIGLN